MTFSGPLIDPKPTSLDDLRKLAAAGQLYAVLDACDAPAVLVKVTELGAERAPSLYRGSAQEEHYDIAPYLVRVDGDLLGWIRETLWLEPWGIFAVADVEMEALHKHLRKFLLVQSPDQEDWYFRYYDPRVLKRFYGTCVADQLRQLFGPVRAYGVGDADTGETTLLWMKPGAVQGPAEALSSGKGPVLRLRLEQVQVFQPEVEAVFVRRIIQHLRAKHAATVDGLADDALAEKVRAGLARARHYGLDWESKLVAFVALMFEFAPNFDEHPRFHRVLTDERIPPDDRLGVLVEQSSEQDWAEVEQRSDPGAWTTPPRKG